PRKSGHSCPLFSPLARPFFTSAWSRTMTSAVTNALWLALYGEMTLDAGLTDPQPGSRLHAGFAKSLTCGSCHRLAARVLIAVVVGLLGVLLDRPDLLNLVLGSPHKRCGLGAGLAGPSLTWARSVR